MTHWQAVVTAWSPAQEIFLVPRTDLLRHGGGELSCSFHFVGVALITAPVWGKAVGLCTHARERLTAPHQGWAGAWPEPAVNRAPPIGEQVDPFPELGSVQLRGFAFALFRRTGPDASRGYSRFTWCSISGVKMGVTQWRIRAMKFSSC